MKVFVMLLFILPSLGHAISCNEIKKDLLAIDYQIQRSKLNECKNPASAEVCCRAGDPNSCKTKEVLEKEYNEALAELVIAEGIASIALSLESNHNALNDLTAKTMAKANNHIKAIDENLTKAQFLFDALEQHSNTYLFSEYSGKKETDVQTYLRTKCSQSHFSTKTFCSEYKNLDELEKAKISETLSGFLNSDKHIISSDREKERRYPDFQDRLRVKLSNQENSLTPNEFKQSKHYDNIKSLKHQLNFLYQQRNNGQNTAETSKKLLDLAKSIDKISMNYNQGQHGGATDNPEATRFIRQEFDHTLNKLDLPSLILEGNAQKNLLATHKRLTNEVKKYEKNLNKDIKESLAPIKTTIINRKSISETCKSDLGIKCLEKLCASEKEHCNFNDANSSGLNLLYKDYLSFKKYEKSKDHLNKAANCLEDKNKTITSKKICLENLNLNRNSNIAQLKQKLKNAQKALHYISSGKPFKALNLQKAMALNAFKANYCGDASQRKVYKLEQSDCGIQNVTGLDYKVLDLGLSGNQAMLTLNSQLLNDMIEGKVPDAKIKNYRSHLVEACSDGKVNMPHICEYYDDEQKWDEYVAEDALAMQDIREVRTASKKKDNSLDYYEASKNAFGVILSNINPLVTSYIETDFVEEQSKMQINSINNYNDIYMANLAAHRAYLENPYETPFYATNWGIGNSGYTYNSYSTFQNSASSSQSLYKTNSTFSFDFQPLEPTVTQGGSGVIPISSSPLNTIPSNNNIFEFKF